MFGKLFLLFITVPLIEMALLMYVSRFIGIGGTLMLIVVTGAVGATLARSQGIGVLHKLQNSVNSGVRPTDAMIEAVLVLIGGIVLLTPGILTDIMGFSLMVPAVRSSIGHFLTHRIASHIQKNVRAGFASTTTTWESVRSYPPPPTSSDRDRKSGDDDIIDI
jgi:UPF0716 protein FxsA